MGTGGPVKRSALRENFGKYKQILKNFEDITDVTKAERASLKKSEATNASPPDFLDVLQDLMTPQQ
eukprot:5329808-Pyramimonas_sp.AAC.1